MTKSPKKIPILRLTLGTVTAMSGTITAIVTVPDIGCRVGWNPAACVVPRQEDGNRYVAGATKLADQSGINVALSMPSGINIVAKVSFPGIPEEINKLEAVEFWIRVNDFFPLKFSDVSVSTK